MAFYIILAIVDVFLGIWCLQTGDWSMAVCDFLMAVAVIYSMYILMDDDDADDSDDE